MDAADAAHSTGAGVDVPPFDATDMIECSLCESLCFEYEHFFMESSHGFKWGRRCPRDHCSYAMCYACVLRLPAPDFACPTCRLSWARVVAIPLEIQEWRTMRDRSELETQGNYEAMHTQLRMVQEYFLRSSEDDDGSGSEASVDIT